MSEGSVLSIDFGTAARPMPACGACRHALARAARYCPYCASAQFETPAPPPDDSGAAASNVIHADFSARTAPQEPDTGGPEAEAVEEAATVAPPDTPAPAVDVAAPEAAIVTPQEVPKPAVAAAPAAETSVHKAGRGWLLPVSLLTLAGVVAIIWGNSSSGPVTGVAAPPVVVAYAARADAVVRDKPTVQSSISLGTLARGETITGSWLAADTADRRWFSITAGRFAGDYVWGRNLASQPRPPLLASLGAEKRTLSRTSIFVSPETGATLLDTIGAGRSTYIVGTVGGGWYEIRLKHGGVGYAQISNFE